MCYSAGSISQTVNQCPMCKVYSHPKSLSCFPSPSASHRCPHIRETCRNRAAHPRMDVLYLKNAEVESFKGCGFCKWANQLPPPTKTGYNNPGWPGCCRPPCPEEVDKIPFADWPAVSRVHAIPIPSAVENVLNALLLPSLKVHNGHQSSPTASLRSPSRAALRKGNGAAINGVLSKSATKPMNVPHNGRGRQGTVTPGSNAASRSASSIGISSSLPSSPMNETVSRRKISAASTDRRNGDIPQSSHSSPSRKAAELESTTPRRLSNTRRPALTPATTSVSLSNVVASDTRYSEIRHDSPNTGSIRRGSSAPTSAANSPMRNVDSFVVPRPPKIDIDSRSSSSGSDGMLSDSTITSEGFTDYLSDESEEELQKQAEARAAVVAQNQMEELEFKMARQQLARVGLEPPKSWTETNTPPVSPTKTNMNSSIPSRNPKIPHSFAVAATAMMQTG